MKINQILAEGPILQTKPQQQTQVPGPGSAELNALQAAKEKQQTQQGANAFGQMAQQLGSAPSASSTGGTTTSSNGTVQHTANTNNPNQPAQAQQQQPAQAQQPAQVEPAQPAPQQAAPAQQKVTVGQINKTIPTLRTRDVQSVKKTADNTLAQKTAKQQPQAQQQQAEPAQQQQQAPQQQAQQQQQGGQFTDQYGDLDPTKLTPDQIRGYKFKNGKLVKDNPNFFTNMGRAMKGIWQKNTGGIQDYRADANNDPTTPQDFRGDTLKTADQMKAANAQQTQAPAPDERVEPTMDPMAPKSKSGIAQGMRTAAPKGNATKNANTAPQQPAQPAASEWVDAGNGVQVSPATSSHPTLGKHSKQLYSLNDKDQWIDQKGKPASVAISTVLNKALEQT